MAEQLYRIECYSCGKKVGYGLFDYRAPGVRTTGSCRPCSRKEGQMLVNTRRASLTR